MPARVIALIPARSGSKGIPHKNIREMAGKPLLAYSIEQARSARLVERTIVSTDDPAYAEISRRHGAETPFLRPGGIAQDASTDLEVFTHALTWLSENEGHVPEICVHLRPTHPVRPPGGIDAAVRLLLDRPDLDSVRSVAPAAETPYKMWRRGSDGLLTPVAPPPLPEAASLPRQLLPAVYLQNASIDAVRSRVILEKRSMTGDRIYGQVMDESFDIDTSVQWEAAARRLAAGGTAGPLRLCFDIDGVIASIVPDNDYARARPLEDSIRTVNALHAAGHTILLHTARGMATGIDWTDLTRRQMADWGVRHHKLLFGKPAADYYIDDKNASMDEIRRLL